MGGVGEPGHDDMKPVRILLALVVLSLATDSLAGGPPGRPVPPQPIPSSPQRPPLTPGGSPRIEAPDPACANMFDQPLITLGLSDGPIWPGSSVTLAWEVKDRRPGIAWGYPVQLRSNFALSSPLPHPAPRSGSYRFVAGRSPMTRTFTLETRCGHKSVIYARVPDPSIRSVTPSRGLPYDRVEVRGIGFTGGGIVPRGSLRVGDQSARVETWTDNSVLFQVPESVARNTTVGIQLHRAPDGSPPLVSNVLPFRIDAAASHREITGIDFIGTLDPRYLRPGGGGLR